jgi:hypothetical protein
MRCGPSCVRGLVDHGVAAPGWCDSEPAVMGGPPTRNRCSKGIGEGREQHASRAPRLLFIRASMRLYNPPSGCALGVWAVACACVCMGVYARACAGRASKRRCVKRVWGQQTLSLPGTLGVCSCVFVSALACSFLLACILCVICVYDLWFRCL